MARLEAEWVPSNLASFDGRSLFLSSLPRFSWTVDFENKQATTAV